MLHSKIKKAERKKISTKLELSVENSKNENFLVYIIQVQ